MTEEDLLPRLEELARRAAEPAGVEVAWVEFKRQGASSLFRVFIDRESGVGLDDCERVNERLGVLLDVEDPIESSYTLEVSTPGLDRPLRSKRDYERFVGRLACIKTRARLEDRDRFTGKLAGTNGENVLLENNGEEWSIPLSLIDSGRLEVEMFRPNKPRKTRPSSRAGKRR
jgi:ribosome maturation factor RimP